MNTQLIESTNQIHKSPPKLLSKRIRKRYYKTLGTSVINSPLCPLSLHCYKDEILIQEFEAFNVIVAVTLFYNQFIQRVL